MNTPPIVIDFASVIQTSLAPVFLLAGTAGFVNVYATRLGKVSDRLNEVADRARQGKPSSMQIAYLRQRVLALEVAVMLGVIAAVLTGSAILNLLAGALAFGLRHENVFWFFGGAIVALIGSLVAFLFELLIAVRNMLRQMRVNESVLEKDIMNAHKDQKKSAIELPRAAALVGKNKEHNRRDQEFRD